MRFLDGNPGGVIAEIIDAIMLIGGRGTDGKFVALADLKLGIAGAEADDIVTQRDTIGVEIFSLVVDAVFHEDCSRLLITDGPDESAWLK